MLMAIPPAVMAVERILRLRLKADAGFVVWDAAAPSNTPGWKHNESLLLALATGLGFCGTDMRHDWALLGQQVLIYVRGLPLFKHNPRPVECYPLVHVGVLQVIDVYIPMEDHQIIVNNSNEFYVGTETKCARGIIQNSHCAFNR
jgi:hypothetical protein